MTYKNIIERIRNLQPIDNNMVESLYRLSIGSLTIFLILTIGVALFLYPVLSAKILLWAGILIVLTLFRLYSVYSYLQNPQRFGAEEWYVKFGLLALLTAFGFSMLSCFFMASLDAYYQLFIITVMIGLASGSMTSLSSDVRLSIAYITILLLPLIMTLILEDQTPFNNILIVALTLYYFSQIGMIIKNYHHELEFKALENRQFFLHNLFQEAPLGIFIYDKEMKIADCNQKLPSLFGHEKEEMIGLDLQTLPDRRPVQALRDCLNHTPQTYIGPYISLKGKTYWIEVMAFPFTDANNKVIGGVGIIEDKTKEHNALQELEYLVEHDVLTGLLNRRGFSNYMHQLVKHSKHNEYYSMLFYLDLNKFKSINDSLGHSTGDALLLAVSKRLLNILPKQCTVSRLGGDEFIIIAPYVTMDQESIEIKSKEYSLLLEEIFGNPFAIDEMVLHIKASIGIVVIEPGYNNIEEIIRYADITMYQAKKSNSHISYYDESLDRRQKELFALQHDLGNAIKNNQLKLFLQPVVGISDDKLVSAELLLRWMHPVKGLLSPDAFIPLAAEAGLLSSITWWVIDALCNYIGRWKGEGMWHLKHISVNINAQMLVENGFADTFLTLLDAHHVNTDEIMIEITERSLIDNFESTQAVISHLRSKGIRCAVDDFGIGYSSLSYLKKLSFHTLKIDKEFVKNIEKEPQELTLMKTILDIGRQFNYHIVVEGIEYEEQKMLLRDLDPKLAYQGYLFSKPLEVMEFEERYLKK